jgi:CheY-like chemotaxis protein
MILSAYMDEDNFEIMKEKGADVCFSKPLPLAQLKQEVSRLLQQK